MPDVFDVRRCIRIIGIGEESDRRGGWDHLVQHFEPLWDEFTHQKGQACDVASRPVEAADESELHRIASHSEYDRYGRSCRLGGSY
jgi:hypothetical protein